MTEPVADHATSAAWRDAFRAVERAWFVPEFFVPNPDRAGWRRVRAPSAQWRAAVDSDDALITQVGGRDHDGDALGMATSSTSAPRLMAAMLDALDISRGHRVLEIGTGTGYNAALLSHRLGDDSITTIDIDPDLVALARRRLAENGFRPSVHVSDAEDGYPARGPYDRILATVALPTIPSAWWSQLAENAKVLLPLDRHGTGGLLALLERHGQILEGRLLDSLGYFMPLRAHSFDPATILAVAPPARGATRATDLPVHEITAPGGSAEHVIALLAGGFGRIDFTPSDTGVPEVWLTRPDHSWARLITGPTGTTTVDQGGPGRIWDGVENAYQWWSDLGRPDRDDIVLTASPEGLSAAVRRSDGDAVPL